MCLCTHTLTSKHPLFFVPRIKKMNTVDIFRLLRNNVTFTFCSKFQFGAEYKSWL